jgi:hypothetical protein
MKMRNSALWILACVVSALAVMVSAREPGASPVQPTGRAKSTVVGRVLDKPGGKGIKGVVVALVHGRSAKKYKATTDNDGNYRIDAVPADKHNYFLSIVNRPPGEGACNVPIRLAEAVVKPEDLHRTTPQTISGTVNDMQTRQPVPGARIYFNNARKRSGILTADAKGRYKLHSIPGTVTLACRGTRRRYLPAESKKNKSVTLEAGTHVKDVDFEVRSPKEFTGEVTLPGGKPAKGAVVDVWISWSDPVPATIARAIDWGPRWFGFRCRTDGKGKFRGYFRRPGPITHHFRKVHLRIVAAMPDRSLATSAIITAEGDEPDLDTVAMPLGKVADALARLIDSDGKGIAGAKFSAGKIQHIKQPNGPGEFGQLNDPGVTAKYLGDGRYRLTGLIPGPKYHFMLTAKGYTAKPIYLHHDSRNYRFLAGEDKNLGTMRLHPTTQPAARTN